MQAVILAAAAVVALKAFNSPSGTLIVDLRAPLVVDGGWKPAEFKKWNLELFDSFSDDKVAFQSVEMHPGMPGYVLETLGKKDALTLGYRMTAVYCNPKSECRKRVFKDVVDVKAQP